LALRCRQCMATLMCSTRTPMLWSGRGAASKWCVAVVLWPKALRLLLCCSLSLMQFGFFVLSALAAALT
jgi:hypothetical protein